MTDAARAILLATEHYNGNEPVNLRTRQENYYSGVGACDCRCRGSSGEIVWDTAKPNGQPRRSGSEPGKQLFVRSKVLPLLDGIQQTVAWFYANRGSIRKWCFDCFNITYLVHTIRVQFSIREVRKRNADGVVVTTF